MTSRRGARLKVNFPSLDATELLLHATFYSAILCLAAGTLAACGGERAGPTTAGATPGSDGDRSVANTLSFVSGITGEPVAGATVTVAGRSYTSDAAGRLNLDGGARAGASVDVVAPGMLDRQTLLRSPAATSFSLWPRTDGSGIDEHYTATLVYTGGGDPPPAVGSSPMLRVAGESPLVVVVLSPELQADGESVEAHQEAMAAIQQANGGSVRYALAASAPAGGVVFQASVDPTRGSCASSRNVLAFVNWRTRQSEIVGGDIVYCGGESARGATVTHEMGHTYGLQHSPDPADVMYATQLRRQASSYGARESLEMRLMAQRRPGNRFPDNDRDLAGASLTGSFGIVCR